MRKQEADAAEDYLRATYEADRVAVLDMDFAVRQFRASPLYVPAYIFRSRHFGTKLRTFVSGAAAAQHASAHNGLVMRSYALSCALCAALSDIHCTGTCKINVRVHPRAWFHVGAQADRVGGARAYDEGKTAVLAGLAAGAGLLLTQAGPSLRRHALSMGSWKHPSARCVCRHYALQSGILSLAGALLDIAPGLGWGCKGCGSWHACHSHTLAQQCCCCLGRAWARSPRQRRGSGASRCPCR